MKLFVALSLCCVAVGDESVAVLRRETPADVVAWRATLTEGRPALRGFRAPILGRAAFRTASDLPSEEALRPACALVARRLARDGLLATTAAAIESLSPREAELRGETERLEAVGLPVDWLDSFRLEGSGATGARAIVAELAARLEAGSNAVSLVESLAKASYSFRASLADFAASSESGEQPIGLARVQIASSGYWVGEGDGGSLDVLRQLLAALPQADFVASVEEKNVESALALARGWPLARPLSTSRRLTLVAESSPVAQWAQDDGKPGLAPGADFAGRAPAILVPRYASRGEDGGVFVPGETFLAEGLAAAGHRVVQSPLLFQGGDLLVAREPKSGQRLLFLGEANLWRNVALGLTREQVLEAFRIELGVDRCIVLPAVSFHVDQEVTFRSLDDRLVAFVADPAAAAKIVLRCGTEALEKGSVLSPAQAAEARSDLAAGKDLEFLALVCPATASRSPAFGRYPESIAASFSRGKADSGVGNLQRFLLAIDLLTSWTTRVADLPFDPHSLAYLRSFQRRDADRREFVAALEKAGCEIVRIPSLPEANRGIDTLNGVQDSDRYLMPAWGGLFAPLDDAARLAFERVLGPTVAVVPVLCSESQRRGGGLHCSLSACPRP